MAADRKNHERGERLKQARRTAAMTQKEMAEQLGMTVNAYQHYEYGKDISTSRLVQICTVLGCTPNHLLGYGGEVKREAGPRTPPLGDYWEELLFAAGRLNDLGKSRLLGYADALGAFDPYSASTGMDECK